MTTNQIFDNRVRITARIGELDRDTAYLVHPLQMCRRVDGIEHDMRSPALDFCQFVGNKVQQPFPRSLKFARPAKESSHPCGVHDVIAIKN